MNELLRIFCWQRLVSGIRHQFEANAHLFTPQGRARAAENVAKAEGILLGIYLSLDENPGDDRREPGGRRAGPADSRRAAAGRNGLWAVDPRNREDGRRADVGQGVGRAGGEELTMLQQTLPFAEADAARAETWNDVYRAILAVDHEDLHLYAFVRLVFEATAGGQSGQFTASHKQIRGPQPRGIMCGEGKARATVARAVAAGIVETIENRGPSGVQRSNSYRICWSGVRSLLGHATTDGGSTNPAALGSWNIQVPVCQMQVPVGPSRSNAHAPRAQVELLTSCSNSKSSVVDDVDETDLDWERVRTLANATAAKAWGDERLDAQDRHFVLGVAILALRFGEEWLFAAAGITRRNPIRSSRRRFLRGVLATMCCEMLGLCGPGEEAKAFFDAHLAATRPAVDRYLRRHPRKATR